MVSGGVMSGLIDAEYLTEKTVAGHTVSRVYVLLTEVSCVATEIDMDLIRVIVREIPEGLIQSEQPIDTSAQDLLKIESRCIGGWHYQVEFRVDPERGSLSLYKIARTPCMNLHLEIDKHGA